MQGGIIHKPVLVREVVELLGCRPGGVFVDCTVGEGGHADAILKKIEPGGRLIGIDQDGEQIALASSRLKSFGKNVILARENFSNLKAIVSQFNLRNIDGILFDLGVSSYHLNTPERGFSFRLPGPLDMRMDRSNPISAAELVNRLSRNELAEIFRRYGEERAAFRIASAIVRTRRKSPLTTTIELAVLIRVLLGSTHRRIHPATRTFQALRIAVNRELENLEKGLLQAISLLKPGGRICTISYHSLEDRIVKHTFRREKSLMILTKTPLTPTQEEIFSNRRARSAKLRAAEKKTEDVP